MKYLFNFRITEPDCKTCKEDIRVTRIFWFSVGFITAVVFIYLTLP